MDYMIDNLHKTSYFFGNQIGYQKNGLKKRALKTLFPIYYDHKNMRQ